MIYSPGARDSRGRVADWLELVALLKGAPAGETDLVSLFKIEDGNERQPARDEEGHDEPEQEIEELAKESFLDRIAEEIAFRSDAVGSAYPFQMTRPGIFLTMRPGDPDFDLARVVYIFCLVLTCFRDGLIARSTALDAAIQTARRLFHVCACAGVAGLLQDGRAIWFGFPRPEKSGFSAALVELCNKLGFGLPKIPPPPGFPVAPKDDQIDVLGWRPFGDRRVSTLVVVCQAATGNKWDDKSVVPHLAAFLDWFDNRIYGNAMAALALPATGHHDVEEPPVGSPYSYEEHVHGYLKRLSDRHGVVLDRLRIVESVQRLSAEPDKADRVENWAIFDDITDWVGSTAPLVA